MTEVSQKLTRALLFAAKKHTDQRRKGERGEPYVNHLIEVADLVAQFTDGKDTDTKYAELVKEFGQNVADIVQECTDDKSLPKAERKRLQVEHAQHKSDAAKLVKTADKISNLRAILDSPPPDWSLARKQEYFTWAKNVVDGMRGVNAGLEGEFDKVYARGAQKFGMKP